MAPPTAGGGALPLPESSPRTGDQSHSRQPLNQPHPPTHINPSTWLFEVLAPLPIGFAVFMVHLATIPITHTGINPARSLEAAVIYNKDKAWDDQ
ncbi:hypothetical protein CICLE_v10003297mg [Citrus x clementina]|uniref:Aquaporin n=1 Tax=Citrus clementina TaxID=85681 RepID=V4V119_CITCL|nr:hypothetical protein CICLE_v10003297mg [Citrus x clementina]